ncbi:hypothetical protein D924_00560 [Enterococcus faecalis 06-MB-S-10]|nr:hypothetical protein [Enterococcus faecalis]EPH82648.1 hypothetical protein D927_01064 [Enterococcus faecalis 02-MB-BW-10]EPH86664.1 hypothetical protein D924_00560 [Enterococcus faecalis 06-MB-S-10]EPH90796.1 hypothetical protein D923_01155 [Enterococcus faecalis 06-MB-S-04]
MDEQILALVNFFETIFRRAKNKEANERLRTIKDLDRAASTLSDIVEFVMTESSNNSDSSIRNQIKKNILKKAFILQSHKLEN